jgi:predicted nucleic acid-binding protein
MILYLDTSALVKRYVRESFSTEVVELITQADVVGSIILAHVEMAATLTKAARQNWIKQNEAEIAWQDFLEHWNSYTRLPVTAVTLNRASQLAWENGLRGYDAMHFASAEIWQQGMGTLIKLATFDRELWLAASKTGMAVWPEGLYS